MPDGVVFTPGMRVLCRDAEWLVTRVDPSDHDHQHHAVQCIGADDLVRGHEAIFLTQLDDIEPVDPRKTQLVPDPSRGYRLAKLFLEAQLRQMPATGVKPDLKNMGAFKPMKFQIQTVEWALRQLRPRLLLADQVGLGKTIQVGMVLSELLRRKRANRTSAATTHRPASFGPRRYGKDSTGSCPGNALSSLLQTQWRIRRGRSLSGWCPLAGTGLAWSRTSAQMGRSFPT
jgi:hypothetical protein